MSFYQPPCISILRSYYMISFEQSSLIILILYALATLCGILGLVLRQRVLRIFAFVFVVLGFGLQTFDMARGSHARPPDGLTEGEYMQLLAWFMILCAFVGQWKTRHTTPLIFMLPPTLILLLTSLRSMQTAIILPKTLSGSFFVLHIGALYISLGLMALAFMAGAIFLYTEKKIKSKAAITGFSKDFPALAILDKANAIATYVGFPLFTVGIVAGIAFASSAFGKAITADPKEVVSYFIWIVYAWLFYMRTVQGRGGRKPAIIALCLFALSLFSMLVVDTFMDTHHSFTEK